MSSPRGSRFGQRLGIPLVAATTLVLLAVGNVAAWSQIYNNFPDDPLSCTDPGGYCIEWPTTPGGLSVNVDVYLYSSLGAANIDLRPDVRNTFPQWNNIAARNPHLQETTSLAASEVDVWRGTTIYVDSWAETTPSPACCSGHTMTYAKTIYNDLVTWNHSYSYGTFTADSRKVTDHEMGHAEALGHTAFTALMKQGPASFWKVQSNDRAGIIAVYGAYP